MEESIIKHEFSVVAAEMEKVQQQINEWNNTNGFELNNLKYNKQLYMEAKVLKDPLT